MFKILIAAAILSIVLCQETSNPRQINKSPAVVVIPGRTPASNDAQLPARVVGPSGEIPGLKLSEGNEPGVRSLREGVQGLRAAVLKDQLTQPKTADELIRKTALVKNRLAQPTVKPNTAAESVSTIISSISTLYPQTTQVQWTHCDDISSSIEAEIYALRVTASPRANTMIDVILVGSANTTLVSGTIKTDLYVDGRSTFRYSNDICKSLVSSTACPIPNNAVIAAHFKEKVPNKARPGVYTIKNTLYSGRTPIFCARFDITVVE